MNSIHFTLQSPKEDVLEAAEWLEAMRSNITSISPSCGKKDLTMQNMANETQAFGQLPMQARTIKCLQKVDL
jgi:hypothetical protein